jgi:3'-phosphoadenosine 5'-phosphosulfate sulfotransferase (PAPS reductase)/FAD synthetase
LATAPALQLPDVERMTAEESLLWAYEQFGDKLCLTCSWQKQSSVLVHMVSELGLGIPVIELDTQLFFKETYETRDRLVERYGLRADPAARALRRRAARAGGPEPLGARPRPLLPPAQGRAARAQLCAVRLVDLRNPPRAGADA